MKGGSEMRNMGEIREMENWTMGDILEFSANGYSEPADSIVEAFAKAGGHDGAMTWTLPARDGRENITALTDAAVASGDSIMPECLALCGMEHEILMSVEEANELSQAALKVLRVKDNPATYKAAVRHLAEEIADVRIMLSQLTMLFDIDADVAAWAAEKVERQANRNRSGRAVCGGLAAA